MSNWTTSANGYSQWRKDKLGNVYILAYKRAKGYSGNKAFHLFVKYADGSSKHVPPHELGHSKKRGSTSNGNGRNNPGGYSKARVQLDPFGFVDSVIARKEARYV